MHFCCKSHSHLLFVRQLKQSRLLLLDSLDVFYRLPLIARRVVERLLSVNAIKSADVRWQSDDNEDVGDSDVTDDQSEHDALHSKAFANTSYDTYSFIDDKNRRLRLLSERVSNHEQVLQWLRNSSWAQVEEHRKVIQRLFVSIF